MFQYGHTLKTKSSTLVTVQLRGKLQARTEGIHHCRFFNLGDLRIRNVDVDLTSVALNIWRVHDEIENKDGYRGGY